MLLLIVAAIFIVLIAFSMPIVFALGVSGVAGLLVGGYDMQVLSSSMVSGAPPSTAVRASARAIAS